MFCTSCGRPVQEAATVCPGCGAPQPLLLRPAAALAVAATAGPLPDALAERRPADDVIGGPEGLAPTPSIPPPLPSDNDGVLRTPGHARRGTRRRLPSALLGLLVFMLISALTGDLFTKSLLDQRGATILAQQQQLRDLTQANISFQDELNGLSAERDQLVADLATRTQERDSLQVDRDALNAQLGSIQAQLSAAQKRTSETEAALADARGKLEQARQDSANQQQQASNANARSAAIAAVLQLDDQIHANFYAFLDEVNTMQQALNRRDYFAASAAYSRAQTIANRLDSLFSQRKAALARI